MSADPDHPLPMPVPASASIPRRQVLHLGLLLGLSGLTGCARGSSPTLMAAPETLPLRWRRQLAKPWRFLPLESSQQMDGVVPSQADLLALPDGWVSSLEGDALQALDAPSLHQRLSPQALAFLERFAPEQAAALLPVSVSPWVMVCRGHQLVQRAVIDGWSMLLSSDLAGQVVLPASPRLLLSLAERMEEPNALPRLRASARVFDDRHALNWLLQGKASVAVLPLMRCMATLRSDPRVQAVLPDQGAPLHWTLLMRPAHTREPLPQAWVEKAWTAPLLGQLLAEAWRPPLPAEELAQVREFVPARLRPLVLPSEAIWQRCWSLAPLCDQERRSLNARWSASSP